MLGSDVVQYVDVSDTYPKAVRIIMYMGGRLLRQCRPVGPGISSTAVYELHLGLRTATVVDVSSISFRRWRFGQLIQEKDLLWHLGVSQVSHALAIHRMSSLSASAYFSLCF